MKSIIEQLFEGDFNSLDKFTRTDEYNKCSSEIIKAESELFEKINEEQKLAFDRLADLEMDRSLIECKTHYICGFKTGFRLADEIYNERND